MALGVSGWAVIRAMDACSSLDSNCEAVLHQALVAHWRDVGNVADLVPYQWQIGRFVRHGLELVDLFALRQMATAIQREGGRQFCHMQPPPPTIYWPYHVVMLCLEYSLHPDKVVALQLFRDVLAAIELPNRQMGGFRRNLFYRSMHFQLGGDQRWSSPAHSRVHADEFLAKAELCLRDEVRFPLEFHEGDIALVCEHLPVRTFALVVDWCMTRPSDCYSSEITNSLYTSAMLETVGRPSHEVAQFEQFAQQLSDFIDLHWPARGPCDTLNSIQTELVQLLAGHLARYTLGTSQVIPHILDYIRVPNDECARSYRQIEAQTAHAAFGRAQLAHAAAATPEGAAPASAPANKRARAEEEEEQPKRQSA